MSKFKCLECEIEFELPAHILEKYPNWVPKYCSKHNPKSKATSKVASNASESKNSKYKVDTEPSTGIFTDGSASPNPGPGGWGLVYVVDGKAKKELSGGTKEQTTNNRMELMAIINAFSIIEVGEHITIFSDSNLCVSTFNEWAHSWKKKGWKKKSGEIKNLDLVKEAYALFDENPNVSIKWVPAHSGWKWNEYVDELAKKANPGMR